MSIPTIDQPEEVLEFINQCLKPKLVEKQQNGEVFTPIEVIENLYDKLDADYTNHHGHSIFSNPELKWFDPAAGMGNFQAVLYLRLMKVLKAEFPSKARRKKHILSNMIYTSELNATNCLIFEQLFGLDSIRLNLHQGDTLGFDPQAEWGVDKFDVIVGNPPYNSGGIKSHNGKQLGAKNQTVWPKFTELALKHLKPEGYLVYITPLSWLRRSHPIHSQLLGRQLVWLELWDNIQSLKTINGKIPISLYVLHNCCPTELTTTRSIIGLKHLKITDSAYLLKGTNIPLAYHGLFGKLAQFTKSQAVQLQVHTTMVKSSGPKTKIPSIYTKSNMWAVDTWTHRDGLLVKTADTKHPDRSRRKLIIANKSSLHGAFIDDGRLGLTGTDKFYILGDRLGLILQMLKFKVIHMLVNFTKYRQDFLDAEVFTFIPDLRKLGFISISEDQFYQLIGFNQDETDIIQKY